MSHRRVCLGCGLCMLHYVCQKCVSSRLFYCQNLTFFQQSTFEFMLHRDKSTINYMALIAGMAPSFFYGILLIKCCYITI